MKKFGILTTIAALVLSANTAFANETIKVGATPVPHAEILEAVKPVLAKEGYDLEIVEFNGAVIKLMTK